MWYTVRNGAVSLGAVGLPVGVLVAARLEPAREYAAIEATVRHATTAFLHMGVYGAATPLLPPILDSSRALRRAMARAARIDLTLVGSPIGPSGLPETETARSDARPTPGAGPAP